METTVALLGGYNGRDKIMRTASYVAMIIAGSSSGKLAKDMGTFARQISASRTVLRLFDDLPMLALTCSYGTGKHEHDIVTRVLSLMSNAANQIYFPLEHISWLATNEVLNWKPSPWATAAIAAWGISLVVGILKSLRMLGRIRMRHARLARQQKLSSPERSGAEDVTYRQAVSALRAERRQEIFLLVKNLADLMNAINWMPEGFLWAGKFTLRQTGIFGLISSIVGVLLAIKALPVKTRVA